MVSNSIKKMRTAAGYSQVALANKLSVDTQTIWRWENGTRTPRWKDIQRMCKRFTGGTVKFRYGDFGDYETTKEFKTDWIMYRRALTDVYGCELEALSIEHDYTLRPHIIVIELYLVGD